MTDTNAERARILEILDRDREFPEEGDERDWKIIARSGEDMFLIQTGPDVSHPRCAGRILDVNEGLLYLYFNVHSLMSRGQWEQYTGSQDILPDLLGQVTRVDRNTSTER